MVADERGPSLVGAEEFARCVMPLKMFYGVWLEAEDADRKVIVRMKEEDFRRELKAALLGGRTVDEALHAVKLRILAELRRR